MGIWVGGRASREARAATAEQPCSQCVSGPRGLGGKDSIQLSPPLLLGALWSWWTERTVVGASEIPEKQFCPGGGLSLGLQHVRNKSSGRDLDWRPPRCLRVTHPRLCSRWGIYCFIRAAPTRTTAALIRTEAPAPSLFILLF